MSASKLPEGWTVELLGLIEGVEFRGPGDLWLLWCDGRWDMGQGSMSLRASRIPAAATMAEARRVGTEYLINCWEEENRS